MEPTPDELAGVADLFSALTRAEFRRAIENVAARQGTEFDPADLDERIEAARREYYLVEVARDGEEVFAPGPAALPTLPEHGEDLPHMMDVPERDVDPADLAAAVEARLEADADAAIEDGDVARLRTLLDVCYDAETWGAVEVAALRERIAGAIDGA
jgi:hypothetical protein